MRVIAGKHRGTVLYEFKGQDIRPTADRTKEAMFNIIQHNVENSICLDLFCGSGNLGIEALSRGAKEVIFIDVAKESVELTKKNLTKVREQAKVIKSDAISFLEKTEKKFDIIFIDPPYANDISIKAVELIKERDILSDNGFIVFERDKPFLGCLGMAVYDERKYGKAILSFVRKEKTCLFAGTFDPITLGHEAIIQKVLKKYDKLHLVIMVNPDKQPMFDLYKRMEMLNILYKDNKRIFINFWEGMLVDYMLQYNIIYNVRGIRSDEDYIYEKEMEEYNKKIYPKIEYDYIYSDNDISSTEARRLIKIGEYNLKILNKKICDYISNDNK